MELNAAMDGGAARREMECAVGKKAGASAQRNSTRWARAMERYFRERDGGDAKISKQVY